jgi:thiol-disulfide isomerase/thioredoxin
LPSNNLRQTIRMPMKPMVVRVLVGWTVMIPAIFTLSRPSRTKRYASDHRPVRAQESLPPTDRGPIDRLGSQSAEELFRMDFAQHNSRANRGFDVWEPVHQKDESGRNAPVRKETPLRTLKRSVTCLCVISIWANAASAQQSKIVPNSLLQYRPTSSGVDYDNPTDPAAINACKVETVVDADKLPIGWALRDGQGRLLRRFVDTDGNKRMDQWSYYQDGFEVYREADFDGDIKPDEIRWLNGGGTRIAKTHSGKIVAWKRISAEESSKILVQALVANDIPLLQTVLATPEELAAAGVPKASVEKIALRAETLPDQVDALRRTLAGWTAQTTWNRFDGTFPHVIPAEPGGVEKDLILYENAMIFPAAPVSGNAAQPRMAFLQVPDVIELGDTWKFIELPRAIDPEKAIVATVTGLRSTLFDRGVENGGPRDEVADAALKALAIYDGQNAALLQNNDKREVAKYHLGRIPLLSAIVKATKLPEDQLTYHKQRVDALVAALRTGEYPQGKKPLEAIVADGGKLASYAAYSLIGAEFVVANEQPGGNIVANQKKWMADLASFLQKYPDSDEAPEVLFQLASANEFNAEEDDARKQYAKVAGGYPNTPTGKKAAGALKRLELNGKPLDLKGEGLEPGKVVDSTQYRNKPLLVVFWTTGAEPVKRDLPELLEVYKKYHKSGLEIIGVNLDNERADLDAFLKTYAITWPQIFEPGGMDGRLSVDYGIISLPTMFLVDDKGIVVNRNLRSPSEAERQLEKLLPQKAAKTAGEVLQ